MGFLEADRAEARAETQEEVRWFWGNEHGSEGTGEGWERQGRWEETWMDSWARGGRKQAKEVGAGKIEEAAEGEKRFQLVKEEAGPPPVTELSQAGQLGGGVEEIGCGIDNAELFRKLQEASRKEAERRYEKWAWLRKRKAKVTQLCPSEKEGIHGRQERSVGSEEARAYVQPELGPVIDEEKAAGIGTEEGGIREEEENADKNGAIAGLKEGDGERVAAEGQKFKPKKRRGKRQRGTNYSEVITINSSGFPQLQEMLQAKGRSRKTVVVLAQEHHRKDVQVPDMQAAVRRHGWKGAIVPAATGEGGGAAAGVAIFTAAHVPCGVQPGTSFDISPKCAQGRAVALWYSK